jgi:hypothetical protein
VLNSWVAVGLSRTPVHRVHNDLLTKRRPYLEQMATDSETGTALLAYAKTGIDHTRYDFLKKRQYITY